jgi:hypothetical protein
MWSVRPANRVRRVRSIETEVVETVGATTDDRLVNNFLFLAWLNPAFAWL